MQIPAGCVRGCCCCLLRPAYLPYCHVGSPVAVVAAAAAAPSCAWPTVPQTWQPFPQTSLIVSKSWPFLPQMLLLSLTTAAQGRQRLQHLTKHLLQLLLLLQALLPCRPSMTPPHPACRCVALLLLRYCQPARCRTEAAGPLDCCECQALLRKLQACPLGCLLQGPVRAGPAQCAHGALHCCLVLLLVASLLQLLQPCDCRACCLADAAPGHCCGCR